MKCKQRRLRNCETTDLAVDLIWVSPRLQLENGTRQSRSSVPIKHLNLNSHVVRGREKPPVYINEAPNASLFLFHYNGFTNWTRTLCWELQLDWTRLLYFFLRTGRGGMKQPEMHAIQINIAGNNRAVTRPRGLKVPEFGWPVGSWPDLAGAGAVRGQCVSAPMCFIWKLCGVCRKTNEGRWGGRLGRTPLLSWPSKPRSANVCLCKVRVMMVMVLLMQRVLPRIQKYGI